MTIDTIFLLGLSVGVVIWFLQPFRADDKHGPIVDILFGIMGAMLVGGSILQIVQYPLLIAVASTIGAVVFIELGRLIEEPGHHSKPTEKLAI